MTLERQIQETVSYAKAEMLRRLKALRAAGEDALEPYTQSPEEVAEIMERHKWLCSNFEKVRVSAPGQRKRMGWSAEALEAVNTHFASLNKPRS